VAINMRCGRETARAGHARGFTLIELVITMAMAAVLSSLALPSYFGHVSRAHRLEGQMALQQLMLKQEQWRSDHAAYAATAAELGAPSLQRYRIAVRDASATGYTLEAQAVGTQAQDRACTVLRVTVRGGDVVYGHDGDASAGPCWRR
jgi:type IV pilus assembly protein PilE